jgi:cyclophilin family peptidyl-prolyl cis-trans isomerase
VLAQLHAEFPDDLRLVYRHFPLSQHDKAALAAQAAESAGLQDKFWEMHDLLFARYNEWVGFSIDEFQKWIIDRGADLGLDVDQFTTDLTSDVMVNLAREAWETNAANGMPSTPFILLNGWPYSGPTDHGSLAATIQMMLLEKRQFLECPPITIDRSKHYFATLHTERGDIKLELYADKAPLAVNNFIFLSRQGWFDGVTFHRVLPNYIAQAGDPSGTGFGGPGYAFDNEIANLTFDSPGVLGMANAGPGSNGSQFFITYVATPNLNGNFTVFGRVISGLDVLSKITPRDPSQSMDLPPGDKILSVTIEEE